jgi:hypothetical protein
MKSIKTRLAVNFMFIIVITVVILELLLIYSVRQNNYNNLEAYMLEQVKVSAELYEKYFSDSTLEDNVLNNVDTFWRQSSAQVQIIDISGKTLMDSIGVVSTAKDVAPDVKPQIIAEFHGKPINYSTENGFEECDTNLIPEQVWEFEYVNHKNNFTSYFNDRTDPINPTLASFEIINSQGVAHWINYKMHGITGASQGIPEGNTITYYEVFPNIDLRYIVDTWRLKEDIIINQPVEYLPLKQDIIPFIFILKDDTGKYL